MSERWKRVEEEIVKPFLKRIADEYRKDKAELKKEWALLEKEKASSHSHSHSQNGASPRSANEKKKKEEEEEEEEEEETAPPPTPQKSGKRKKDEDTVEKPKKMVEHCVGRIWLDSPLPCPKEGLQTSHMVGFPDPKSKPKQEMCGGCHKALKNWKRAQVKKKPKVEKQEENEESD